MQLIEKVQAYRTICRMMTEEWDFSFIYPLVCLLADLAPDYEYFSGEEMKLVALYGKKEDDGTVVLDAAGRFNFADTASAAAYEAAHRGLCATDTAPLPKRKLACPDHIRGQWLNALLPFCEFQKAGDPHGQTA